MVPGGEHSARRAHLSRQRKVWQGFHAHQALQDRLSSSIARAAEKLIDLPALMREITRLLPEGTTSDGYAVRLLVEPFVQAAYRPGALRPALISVYRHGWQAGHIAAKDAIARLTPVVKADQGAGAAGAASTIDWNTWTPGDPLAADEARGLDALLAAAVGRDPGWAARAAGRGNILASIEDNRISEIADALSAALARGDTPDALEADLRDVLTDNTWSDMVATTEMARAMTASTLATYGQNQIPAKEYLTAKDSQVCPACGENEDAGVVPLGESFPNGDPPAHPNCLIGTMRVVVPGPVPPGLASDPTLAGAGLQGDASLLPTATVTEPGSDFGRANVRAATDRHYVGDVITIRLASGHGLTGTPNHPIATTHGWVSLAELREGDHVLHSRGAEWIPGIDPDVDDVPPSIEQVAKSFSVPLGPVPSAAEDFHGDGAGSEVHVVRTDGLLWSDASAVAPEPGDEIPLGGAGIASPLSPLDSQGAPFLLGDSHASAPNGGMGSGSERGAFLGAGLRHPQGHGIAPATDLDSTIDQPFADGASADTEGFCEGLLAVAIDVAASDLVSIERHTFSGHVFNLDTVGGWYIGNGILTHNCRCALLPAWIDVSDAAIGDLIDSTPEGDEA